MEMAGTHVFLSLLFFFGCVFYVHGYPIKYDTSSKIVEGKLNVHLVPHSHDDVGWLKTIDQYYVGSNNSIQGACVRNVLDSVVASLVKDSNRKFVFAEQAFFQRWWIEQNKETQDIVKELVDNGQLEFINGGWCMHDEATCHYIDMIDQTTLGHRKIKQQFNKVPRVGWQIDPFGHSAVQAYLFGAELGFDSLFFARIDYQDRAKRKEDKSLEVIWRGSRTFGSSSQLFTSAFPDHYGSPTGFDFEANDDSAPIQDDPLLYDYNVEERVNDFLDAAMAQANVTRGNHIMWTMGDDFKYQYAESWYKQMDKFIHYVNKDGRVNSLYSTPSIYTDAKNAANESWPLKTNDYFPYADNPNAYWTGFFTSRPSLKRYVRMLSGYYLAARQIGFLAGRASTSPNTYSLGDALAIVQHHDAVTGTEMQHTANDYATRLARGAAESEMLVNVALSCLTKFKSSKDCGDAEAVFSQCPLLNISYCPVAEEMVPEGKSLVIVAYNSLGWSRKETIRIPVEDDLLVVKDSNGKEIEAQYIMVDNVTSTLRNFYASAYLGAHAGKNPKFWLAFQASVPPLGWSTYFISRSVRNGTSQNMHSWTVDPPQSGSVEVGPGEVKMIFSAESGQLEKMVSDGLEIPLQQSYLWYASNTGDLDPQKSGAYIFRPNGSTPAGSPPVSIKISKGPILHEVHQQFNSWIYQVTRIYKGDEHAEIEFTIGPIPVEDGVGKEVITRITTNMATNRVFSTDSNGRDFLRRVRDFRDDWNLNVTQPVAGNYYPLNLGMYIVDNKTELSILVDRATGGASLQDGQVELMLHRRILLDDSRGVGEALTEVVCVDKTCEGIKIRGSYYVSINKIGSGAKWRRTVGQRIYSPLLLAFTHEEEGKWKKSHATETTFFGAKYELPPNVALITLQELEDGNVLLRLAHLYEAGEDKEHSTLTKVELRKIFAGRTIKELTETSLSTNQDKASMKQKTWRIDGEEHGTSTRASRGGPVEKSTLVVELAPMEIRTFVLKLS